MEAHQRAARSGEPPRRRSVQLPGFVQLPIDSQPRIAFAKPEPEPVPPPPVRALPERTSTTQRVTSPLPVSPPPTCPTALPYPDPNNLMPPMKSASFLQSFADLSWHVCLTDMGPKGLWVGPVQLQYGDASAPWMPILYQAGLADIFVPYHNDAGARYYDLGGGASRALSPITLQDVGLGQQLWLSNENFPTVAVEIRDRGPGWLCKGNSDMVRRGQELVLWAVSDAGNYDNIIEFTFRDDGGMTFRTGNTGYNSPNASIEPHSHDAIWYVDVDLNGWWGDSASLLTHVEPSTSSTPLLAQDIETQIALESTHQFQPLVTLAMEDARTNFLGQRMSYELLPLQNVVTRHWGWEEAWTTNDIYITRYNFNETLWASPLTNHQSPDAYLLPALDNQPIVGEDLVYWVKTAVHHHPSTEDLGANALTNLWPGVTLTHWSGFSLLPRNLFPNNPLGAPIRCGD